jgi:hypothetical protein
MKTFNFLLGATLFVANYANAQYCIPPSYTSGPYTAITKMHMGPVNHISGTSEGYQDNTETVDPIDLGWGSEMGLAWTLYYDPFLTDFFTGDINFRVWIDWNQDEDFNDPGETVISQKVTQTSEYTDFVHFFTVPETATLGLTRMRIYEDMLVEDGHEIPNPCGYDSGLGQHGESADYTINVVSETTTGIVKSKTISSVSLYPNPSSDFSTLSFNLETQENIQIHIVNVLGEEVFNYNAQLNAGFNKVEINTSNLENGVYFVQLISDEKLMITERLVIN